jgi:hypothetical protein
VDSPPSGPISKAIQMEVYHVLVSFYYKSLENLLSTYDEIAALINDFRRWQWPAKLICAAGTLAILFVVVTTFVSIGSNETSDSLLSV